MKLALSALILATAVGGALAQGIVVKNVELTKDDGHHNPGKVVKSFAPEDSPFHCVMHLQALAKPAVFSGTLIAADAAGMHNYKVVGTEIAARVGMDLIDFKFSLPRPWPKGKYRIDIASSGKPLRTISFEIK